MRRDDISKYLDELIEEEIKKREFMNCCPCCGKPLIIRRDGIYYSVREFEDIDFASMYPEVNKDGDKDKEHTGQLDVV